MYYINKNIKISPLSEIFLLSHVEKKPRIVNSFVNQITKIQNTSVITHSNC
jgi:hypothetical protein